MATLHVTESLKENEKYGTDKEKTIHVRREIILFIILTTKLDMRR